jgi:hypothetical protein
LTRRRELAGFRAIDEGDEGASEGFDAFGCGAGFGKMEAGGGCDTVGGVAGTAAGFFEDLEETGGEGSILGVSRGNGES